ncbi:lactam utilization protein LamB [Pseudalgibacter alginicilyticus]|uniref:Lactam utilization protein LamB n=1 Tax=Pseudalgibacter alginicilyticus TaxID=1736674 RepID=A0A0P0CDZ7_9FLAO|nr:5-oxoprolinase subunit PxpA [Pseudalgibacter alginicilyticus]ALJ04304.1 lactam utilization protein LamB [Pseudalgibacter alginicilyticus]
MQSKRIDINVDMGEGIGNDAELMPYISACNIACGGHAGNLETMRQVVSLAKHYEVKVGAHPSFPDKINFGRVKMNMSSVALFDSLKQQIGSLYKVLQDQQIELHHIKPHGALYNLAALDERIAKIIIDVVISLECSVKLFVPYKSIVEDLAIKNNISIAYEAFADRNYNDDLSLVSRSKKDAVIHNSDMVFNHVFRMIEAEKVKTISGKEKPIKAETFCLHGDNSNVVDIIKNLRMQLERKGIQIS